MDVDRKCDFRARKFRTTHKFRGSRQKGKRKASKKKSASAGANPNLGRGDAFESDRSSFIGSADKFVSASEKKIGMFQNGERAGDDRASTVICEIGAMKALVSGAACSTCGKCELAVQESVAKRKGLASFLELCCQNDACPTSVLSSTYSSRRASAAENVSGEPCGETRNGSSRDSYAVNVKAVVAARAIGVGHEQLSRFCVLLGLPKPMHHKTFAGITKKVHLAATKAAAVNLELSRKMTAEEVETTQVAVMFDGTWQKRGHKSHNGVGTAISVDTGLCLDTEVLSNYCLSCSRRKAFEDEGEEEVWQAFHKLVCEKNTAGSSHAMETEAAMRIWQRTSSYATPLQFTTFLSDGDSKAYAAVSEANFYGTAPIVKEDCTNHVAKRLGTGLRKLKTPLPRGQKLKDGTIQKLQSYFQIAITSNRGSVRGVYCAIWASYFHSCSTDLASSHKFCPDGESSWCKHKRAQALGEPAPPHTPILTTAQAKAILPIYKRLTEEKLLSRCVQGKTQNAAESLNSKIWMLCPKTRFASRTVVEMATAIATLWFNKGHTGFEQVLQELGILPSQELVTLGNQCDKKRIASTTTKGTAEARSHRRRMVKRARVENSARMDCEGATYGAGQF
ncbi:unnamed protein product [Ixodes hexagonus]